MIEGDPGLLDLLLASGLALEMNFPRAHSRFRSHLLPAALVLALVGLLVWTGQLLAQPKSANPSDKGGQTGGEEKAPPKKRAPRRALRWWNRINWIYAGPAAGVGAVLLTLVVVYRRQNRARGGRSTAASDVIGGYRLQNLMMTGQTSQVWEIVETASGRHFAMKLLLPEKLEDEEHRQLLFHEAEVGIQLAHPNIIKIIKLVKDPDNPYFVMEFFPAGNLKLRVMHKKWDFIKEHAHEIFKQTATGLAYMNSNGWVHRDVKPDNLMVNSAGEVRLIDFALAQRIGKRFGRGKAAGTRSYMSPEQIRGEALDTRADIYSFGASAYEVATGRPPFRAATPTDLLHKQILEKPISPQVYNADITDQFAALILRCLAKKKQERPRDFHEVLMALRGMQVFKSEAAKPRAE